MDIFFEILSNDIVPIFLVVLAGWLLAHFCCLEIKTLTTISINALMPALIVSTLTSSQIDWVESGRMALFCLVCILLSGGIARSAAWLLRLDRVATVGLMLVVMFTNVGNFGLPVVTFAFGEGALVHATVYFVVSNVLLYTLGLALVTAGRVDLKGMLVSVVQNPIILSVALSAALILLKLQLPPPAFKAVDLLGRAAPPAMLLILGMQLHNARFKQQPLTWLAVGLRLAIVPLAAFPVLHSLNVSAPAMQAGMLQAATPSGVATTLLAVEYSVEPEFVNNVVLLSTLMSAFTLTPLILLFR